jgi:serine/threonine-protein kinase RsbW
MSKQIPVSAAAGATPVPDRDPFGGRSRQDDVWDRLAALAFGDLGSSAGGCSQHAYDCACIAERSRPADGRRLALLRIPAAEAYVSLARTTAMTVAGMLGFTVGRVADLRLAVDEACGWLLRAAPDPAGALELHFDRLPGSLQVTVRGRVAEHLPDDREELARVLLEALTTDLSYQVAAGTGTIGFTERLPEGDSFESIWPADF